MEYHIVGTILGLVLCALLWLWRASIRRHNEARQADAREFAHYLNWSDRKEQANVASPTVKSIGLVATGDNVIAFAPRPKKPTEFAK